jgi:integrase
MPINGMLYETLSGMVRNLKTDYLFYDPRTLKPLDRLDKSWHTALKKAKIVDFHFHDLRHTFASWLVMKGADLAAVQKLLGHKSITMTMRYAHLSAAHTKNAVGLLDKSVHSLFIVDENKKISEL